MKGSSITRVAVFIAFTIVAGQGYSATPDPLTDMLIKSGLKSETKLHPSVRELIDDQGFILRTSFKVGDELIGFALENPKAPAKPVMIYQTSDGLLIHGEVRDTNGQSLTKEHLKQYFPGVASKDLRQASEAGFAITEGTGLVVLDVFLDPQCRFCKKLWQDLRGELDFVTVNWLPIAIFPGSLSQVSSLMQSRDPVLALEELARGGAPAQEKPPTPFIVAGVRNNTQRMQQARLTQTPSGFIKVNGQVRPFQGADVIQTIRRLRY